MIPTSELLKGVVSKQDKDNITLHELMSLLHERGFGLILIILSLPVLVPLPGITIIIGIPMMIFTVQMMLGHEYPYIPYFIGSKSFQRGTLSSIVEKAAIYLQRVEKIMRPRMFAMSSKTGERVIGFFGFLCAISVALPIPFGNAIPSLGIVTMSVGLLSRDGLIVLLGIIISIIGIIVSTTVVILGAEGIKFLIAALSKFVGL